MNINNRLDNSSNNQFYHVQTDGKLNALNNLESALENLQNDGGYVWLNYLQPTREELNALIEPFGIHPLSMEKNLLF